MTNLVVLPGNQKIGRQDLKTLPTPEGTITHRPIPHWQIVEALIETLGFRHLNVFADEYAVSRDSMKMFGVLDLQIEDNGIRISIGIRNSHDKTMSLALTVGYRVMVCQNMAFYGDFSPIMKKHSKNLDLIAVVALGVEQIQRNFQPLIRQVNVWKGFELSDLQAKAILCDAFIQGQLKAPKHLGSLVHKHYFEPEFEDFKPRNFWSLNNAFTTAFKALDPIPQFQATMDLAAFLEPYQF